MRRLSLLVAITVAGHALGVGSATAQNYPSRPVTMIVPFPAAGSADVLARLMTDRMRASLGQSVIVENVSGAAGSIAVGRVARAAPDGYTLILGNLGTHVVNGAIYALPYDVQKDFEPVALLPSNYQLILASKATPAKDLKELIAWVKANGDKVTVGTAGPGSPSHLTAAYFQTATDARFQFVPYRGTPQVIADLVAGQINLVFDQVASSLPQVRSGTIKAYAVTSKTRLDAAPDIPTADEAGLPGFMATIWFGLWAPKGTPPDVVNKLNAAVVDTLGDPAVRARLADLGAEIPPREQLTPQALAAFHKAEIEKWWPIIKAANIKGE